MSNNATTTTERAEAREKLRAMLQPGSTVYTILRHVSGSGMSRVVDLVIPYTDERSGKAEIRSIGWLAARAMGETFVNDKHYGIKISGAGMDMGFALVYNLGRTLFPDGFAPTTIGIRPADGKRVNVDIGRGRNAGPMTRAEFAALAAKGWTFPGGRNGDESGWDDDGGYALNHRWL